MRRAFRSFPSDRLLVGRRIPECIEELRDLALAGEIGDAEVLRARSHRMAAASASSACRRRAAICSCMEVPVRQKGSPRYRADRRGPAASQVCRTAEPLKRVEDREGSMENQARANFTTSANAEGLFTARSARILRLISISFLLSPAMSRE